MLLVVALQALEDLDRLLDGRLADLDLLEAARQRAVALERALYSAIRRRADAAQLARGEGGLEDVRGVHRPAADRAGADDGVDLVDEEDRVRLASSERIDDGLQPLLELAAILRAGEQRAHVERTDDRVLQRGGHLVFVIFSASPSAMAVLPTPGSPTKSGLFLRRRQRI